jgi:hypothetical protein
VGQTPAPLPIITISVENLRVVEGQNGAVVVNPADRLILQGQVGCGRASRFA